MERRKGRSSRGPAWWWVIVALSVAKAAISVPGAFAPELAGESPPFPIWLNALTLLTFAGAASLLIAGSNTDPRARWLGGAFLSFATVFGDRFLARLAGSDLGAGAMGPQLLIALRPEAFAPLLLWLFAREFPSGNVFGRARLLPAVAIPVAAICGATLSASSLIAAWYRIGEAPLLAPVRWLDVQAQPTYYWTILIVLVLPALPFIVWKERVARISERRRARLFVAGLLIGWMPQLVDVLLEAIVPPFGQWASGHRWITGVVVYPPLLSIPFVTAYSVLVERVLDVQLVVRKALQYALVRYAAYALLAVPFAGAAAYFYVNRDSTISGLVSREGLTVMAIAAVGGLCAARYGPRIFERIDRRFFREQYDARRILGELIDRSRRASSAGDLSRVLTQQIDRALHLGTVLLFVRDRSANQFVTPDRIARPLRADATLVVLIAASAEPFDVEVGDSAMGRLPDSEMQWLLDVDAQLLVPLLGSDGGLLGIIAIGEKLSELPFSSEDRRLLREVAASAALALENIAFRSSPSTSTPGSSPAGGEGMDRELAAECSRCGAVQAQASGACPSCDGALTTALVPAVLHGKFRLERRLGAGGMGVVYLARDLALNRYVAIKTLQGVSPDDAARLRREARAMAAVSHPNLAQIFGAETWYGTPMLIVEYLHGGTLAARMARVRLTVDEVLHLGLSLADALGRLHASGLLHRDVKPSNVGFTADGVPKLLDFGLAKLFEAADSPAAPEPASTHWSIITSDITDPLRILGTPLYLSPEAVQGLPPDPTFDLWALAVVLYEALAGRNPLKRNNLSEMLNGIMRADIPDIRSLAPGCPASLAAFLADALHARRDRRPASALEFRARLAEVAAAGAGDSTSASYGVRL